MSYLTIRGASAAWLSVVGLGLGLGLAGPARAQDTAPPAPGSPAQASPKGGAPSQAVPGRSAQDEAGEPRADTSGAAPAPSAAADAGKRAKVPGNAASKPAPSEARGPGKSDRLDLGLATVTGDHEQPKVLYIVPWKKSDIGDLQGRPMNSLVDEILSPVDRDVFKREVVYYKAVQGDTSQNGARAAPAPKGEK